MSHLLARLSQKVFDRILPWDQPRSIILMYHRVIHGIVDPWGLAVSPDHFDAQMEMLTKKWHPISLDQLVADRRSKRIQQRTVAVTFDDGYADNFASALPIMQAHHVPATLFVASGLIDQPFETWWDELSGLLLETKELPKELPLVIKNKQYRWSVPSLTESDLIPQVNQIRPWLAKACTRLHLYYDVWKVVRPLDRTTRTKLLEQIADWANVPRPLRRTHRLMSIEELRQFAATQGITLGGHTQDHPALSLWDAPSNRNQILLGNEWLRNCMNAEPKQFAYPFGDWNKKVARCVRAMKLESACTTTAGSIGKRTPLYSLPRLPVDDIDGEQLNARLERLLRR